MVCQSSSKIRDMNLMSSLYHYAAAISEFNRLFKFKNMFNALELLVNIDGKDRKQEVFDAEAKRLDPTNCKNGEKWRNFYNRTKHVQRHSTDIKVYEEGKKIYLTNWIVAEGVYRKYCCRS
ncbi:MAG: hypothetical protein ACJ71K_21160 [Nitrososphaeraceae archaeon]